MHGVIQSMNLVRVFAYFLPLSVRCASTIRWKSQRTLLPPNLCRTLSVLSPVVSDDVRGRTMPGYPYLTFGQIKVQEEKYSLSCDESLYVMRHKFFAHINHLEDQ